MKIPARGGRLAIRMMFATTAICTPMFARPIQAQGTGSASSVAALIDRCTSQLDERACRRALRVRSLADAQRSTVLTYLAEVSEESRDSLLRAAVRADPRNALAHYQLGASFVSSGVPAGLQHLRRALELRPDWTGLHAMIARSYAHITDMRVDTLLPLWRAAVSAEPSSVQVRTELGRALLRAKRYAEAEGVFRTALSIDSADPDAVNGTCLTLLYQEKAVEAHGPCARAITGWGTYHGGDLREVLWIAEEHKVFDLALAAAQQGLAEQPASSFFRSDRTRLLHEMGRASEAKRLLVAYVKEHPQEWTAVDDVAEYLYGDDDLAPALDLYRRLLVRPCGGVDVACTAKGHFALASLRMGHVDNAFVWLDSALTQQSDCPDLVREFRRYSAERPDSAAISARLHRALDAFGARIAASRDAPAAGDFFTSVEQWDRAAERYHVALDSALAREGHGAPFRSSDFLRWQYGRALVEMGRYCEGLRLLEVASKTDPLIANGRPFLTDALDRARRRCTETR